LTGGLAKRTTAMYSSISSISISSGVMNVLLPRPPRARVDARLAIFIVCARTLSSPSACLIGAPHERNRSRPNRRRWRDDPLAAGQRGRFLRALACGRALACPPRREPGLRSHAVDADV